MVTAGERERERERLQNTAQLARNPALRKRRAAKINQFQFQFQSGKLVIGLPHLWIATGASKLWRMVPFVIGMKNYDKKTPL